MRRWALAAGVVFLVSAAAPGPADAQQAERIDETARVREGGTVRVHVQSDPSILSRLYPHEVYEGTVTSYTTTSLVLTPTQPMGLDTFELPWTDVERLEVGTLVRGSFWRGALIGAPAVGAGLALVGMAACSGEACAFGDLSAGGAAAMLGGIGVGVGFVLGGVIGANSEREQWEEVPLESLRVGADASGAGLAIALRLRL